MNELSSKNSSEEIHEHADVAEIYDCDNTCEELGDASP